MITFITREEDVKTVYCECLIPDGAVLEGHTGLDTCCDDSCPTCGNSSCYPHHDCDRGGDEDAFYGGVPWDDGVDWGFAETGRSALRASTHSDHCLYHGCHGEINPEDSYCRHCGGQLNPRKYPCPTCGAPGVLTDADLQHHYQCDSCADAIEQGYDRAY